MFEPYISNTGFLASCILVITIGKGCWDLFLYPRAKKKDLDASARENHNPIIEKWRERDGFADKLTFLSVTALSAGLLALGFSQERTTTERLNEISARLGALEQDAGNGASPVPDDENSYRNGSSKTEGKEDER